LVQYNLSICLTEPLLHPQSSLHCMLPPFSLVPGASVEGRSSS